MRITILGLLLLTFSANVVAQTDEAAPKVTPLPNAHAHNDYFHKRPLLDALDHGFCSVEADVFLVDGELLIGHFPFQLNKKRTLRSLYLDPLRKRVAKHKGHVYQQAEPSFTLLIDLKSPGTEVFTVLHRQLEEYKDMLTGVEDGKLTKRAITVVISGNRPQELIAKTNPRFCGIDGRLGDLDTDKPAHLMPLISDNWGNHFSWTGDGPMPKAEQKKLQDIVGKAHAAGRRIRFWAIPHEESVWRELNSANVDMINTDQLERLQTFLLNEQN